MDTCKEHKHVLHNSVQMFKRELINISSPRQTECVLCYKICAKSAGDTLIYGDLLMRLYLYSLNHRLEPRRTTRSVTIFLFLTKF